MKITIWGARGSIPAPLKSDDIEAKICRAILDMPDIDTSDAEAVHNYVAGLPPLVRGTASGNTACVEIEADGQTFIIDAGSGIRDLGAKLMQGPCRTGEGILHIFFSHPHWDHIQGFPFFTPAFIPGNRIFIYSIHDMQAALEDQQQFRNFPVSISYMQAHLEFVRIRLGEPLTIGDVRINTIENAHPGKAYGFRFEDQHSVFVHASDSEYKHLTAESVRPHIDFFRNADALIFDSQYTLKEAWQKVDWGHSSALIGVDLARAAGVKRLLLFHYDPSYSDDQIQAVLDQATAYQNQDTSLPTCEVLLAREGMTLDLTPPGAVNMHLVSGGQAAVFTPTSIFDRRGVDQLVDQLTHLTDAETPSNAVIDLSAVETLSTASLKYLINLHHERDNRQIVLINPSQPVQDLIEKNGFADFFAVYSSVEAALAAIQARELLNLPGQVIGARYRIANRVGTGRLGTVIEATDTLNDEPVALKILSPAFSKPTIDRFLRQAEQLISLDQRNIVRIFAWEQEGEHTFMVEELITAPTLHDMLTDPDKAISADQALDIALDITLALEYAHSRGVVHGNLTAQNVFITAAGAKLSDFGLGRLEEGRDLLKVPLLHLTPAYLAPEQILGQALDARTDLYALGVILYQLFTTHLPFEGADDEVLQAHLHQAPRPPRERNPHVSHSLEHLILKLLAKNPNNRYASAEQARRVSNSLIINTGESIAQRRERLVGRETRLRALRERWEIARRGRGQLAFITGELGIGKSALAQQVALQSETLVVLTGHCREAEGGVAYQPFSEALSTYFATVPPEVLDDQARRIISNFSRLIPDINKILPDLAISPPLEPKQEQVRLMASLTQFIKRATRERPWLLILEDLHLADQTSLDLLRYLGRHVPAMPLLIIGTYSDVELDADHPLRETLRELHSHPTYLHLPLDRLDQAQTGEMLVNTWDDTVPADLVEKVYRHTGGNPFYVEEVANGLMEDGFIVWQDGAWKFSAVEEMFLPQSVRDAVWRRIRHLSPDTQELLRSAAVLGRTFKLDDLQAMSGLSMWRVLEQLDFALVRQLVQEGPGEGTLSFSHAEIHDVIYSDLSSLRRLMLHRQAGEALEKRAQPHPEQIAEALAHHFSEAGDYERAFTYSVMAARRAKETYANAVALRWYEWTLAHMDQLVSAEQHRLYPVRLSIHRDVGQLLTRMGRYSEALDHYTWARALVEIIDLPLDQSRQLADLCRQTAEVHQRRSEYGVAFEWVKRGLEALAGNEQVPEVARLYLMGARLFEQQDRLPEAETWSRKSLELALALDTPEGRQIVGYAYFRLGAIYARQGDYEREVSFGRKSLKIFQEIDDLIGQSNVYNNLGVSYLMLGDWERAAEVLTTSLTLSQKIGEVEGQGMSSYNLASIHRRRGEWEIALHLLAQSDNIWKQIGATKLEATTLIDMAQVYLDQEDWPAARECLSRSEALFDRVDSAELLPDLARQWAILHLETGEITRAREYAGRSLALAHKLKDPLREGLAGHILGRVQMACDEPLLARQALRASLKTLSALKSKYDVAQVQASLGQLLLQIGPADEARRHLLEARATFARLGAEPDLAATEDLLTRLTQ